MQESEQKVINVVILLQNGERIASLGYRELIIFPRELHNNSTFFGG